MNREDVKNLLPRFRLFPPSHAFKVLFSSLAGHTSPLSTIATEQQIAGIERKTMLVPAPVPYNVSYLVSGPADGRRIIFIHGTPGNARGWADYLLNPSLSQRHIALDRPGYGFSEPREAVVSLTDQAQAIYQLTEGGHTKKPILVGHSLGASVAVQAALDYPGAIGGLLLLAGAFDPDLEEANWLQAVGTLKPVAWLLPRTIDNANRELLGLRRDLLAQAGRLRQIDIPVSIVHGSADPLVPIANLDYLQEKLEYISVNVHVLHRRNHFIPWNSKSSIDKALARLIEQVRTAETGQT